ncbi:hypothetical protein PFISCL1PPCAC_7005, partial [Pristionchus fissidentatus]
RCLIIMTRTISSVSCSDSRVACNLCTALNSDTCNSGITCVDNYCIYQRTTINGYPSVVRTCTPVNFTSFPDQSNTTVINQCEKKTIDGIEYAYEVCNTGDFCDTHCSGSSNISLLLALLLLPIS